MAEPLPDLRLHLRLNQYRCRRLKGVLFGTGIRFRSNLLAMAARIGGEDAPVNFAGTAPGLIGVDQINLRVPRSLIGRGEVEVMLTLDGRTANTTRVNIR